MTFEEAKAIAIQRKPNIDSFEETDKAFIFSSTADENTIGPQPIVVIKRSGELKPLTEYICSHDGISSTIRPLQTFDGAILHEGTITFEEACERAHQAYVSYGWKGIAVAGETDYEWIFTGNDGEEHYEDEVVYDNPPLFINKFTGKAHFHQLELCEERGRLTTAKKIELPDKYKT